MHLWVIHSRPRSGVKPGPWLKDVVESSFTLEVHLRGNLVPRSHHVSPAGDILGTGEWGAGSVIYI